MLENQCQNGSANQAILICQVYLKDCISTVLKSNMMFISYQLINYRSGHFRLILSLLKLYMFLLERLIFSKCFFQKFLSIKSSKWQNWVSLQFS